MEKKSRFLKGVVAWPVGFSIVEIIIAVLGILISCIIYWQTEKIRQETSEARIFEQETRSLIIAVSDANIKFTSLIKGSNEIDLNEDVYAQLDKAQNLCKSIDILPGRPSLTPDAITMSDNFSLSVCDQVSNFRESLQLRWMDYINGNPDSHKSDYDNTYDQLLLILQRYNDANDPRIRETEQKTKLANIFISLGVAIIFLILALLARRSRISSTIKTKQLEDEVEQRKKLFQDLTQERNLINTLIDNIPDAVFAKDKNNRYLIANPAEAYTIGAAFKSDLIGKSEEDFQPTEVAKRIQEENDHILATGEPLREKQAFLIDTQTGLKRWRQTTKVPLRNETGEIIGLLGISRDITAQRETEEALKKANEKLTEGITALEMNNRVIERISEMVDLLQASPNLEEAFKVIANQMGNFFPEDSGVLYLYHSSRNILERVTAWGRPLEDPIIFKPDDCWGLRRGRMHIINESVIDSGRDVEHNLVCAHIQISGPADYLCMPLVAQGEAIGLLHLCHPVTDDYKAEWYDHQKRQRIITIVDSLSLALANLKLRATLREQTIRDPLTNLFNRRYMEETLEREILRAKRKEDMIGVIMLDIDHFKLFNDNFGHQAGDTLLTAIGNFLQMHIRGEDVACRYGGEEFFLVLPGAKLEPTQKRAQDLIDKVKYLSINFQGKTLGMITLSAGVAVFPENGTTTESLVQSADQALYRAKQEGRDRVIVAR